MDDYTKKIYEQNLNFVNLCALYLIKEYPNKYNFVNSRQKYDAITIITEVIYLLITGVSYRNYRGPVNPKTLNKHVLFISHNHIFENIYRIYYNRYEKEHPHKKYKYLSVDTTFVMNKNGKEIYGRNKQYKWKNGLKISIISDTNKIPIDILVDGGNVSDLTLLYKHFERIKLEKYSFVKPYLLADKIYDSKKSHDLCGKSILKPLIDKNNRNTKDKKLIKKFTKQEKAIYKKRIVVENSFCRTKQFRRILNVWDAYYSTFTNFVYLNYCLMISKIM